MQRLSLSGVPYDHRSAWVSLRTLILVRWVAILGQITAIALAVRYFGLQIDIGLCSLAIGASVILNLLAMFLYPESKRLNERQLMLTLLFDLAQLGALLFLSGGLNNPFAVLLLAPITIAATALPLRSSIVVGLIGIVIATLLWRYHMPIVTASGMILRQPQTLLIGSWLAIVIGTVFLGIYAQRVASEIATMAEALLATQMALGREQKISDLAGVVAATAHELGTPLATIKLTSTELAEELADNAELREDALLIAEQADRCRDILHSMGRAGKQDRHMEHAPISALVEEAAEPHMDRGKAVVFTRRADQSVGEEPEIQRLPEFIHGIRNLVQNAVDFARTTVWVDIGWNAETIWLRIVDDGRGYPPQVIGRIGDPFVRQRQDAGTRTERPGYGGMGLGLFIAKTLLERTDARLTFANGRDPFTDLGAAGERSGAIVEVRWDRKRLEPRPRSSRQALGENPLLNTES